MKEREFLGYVIDTARRFGWRAWHVPMPVQRIRGGDYVPDPRGAGIPDLILFHLDPPRLIFAELKAGSRVSEAQEEFLDYARAVAGAGHAVGAYVWTPADRDELEQILRSKVLMPV